MIARSLFCIFRLLLAVLDYLTGPTTHAATISSLVCFAFLGLPMVILS